MWRVASTPGNYNPIVESKGAGDGGGLHSAGASMLHVTNGLKKVSLTMNRDRIDITGPVLISGAVCQESQKMWSH